MKDFFARLSNTTRVTLLVCGSLLCLTMLLLIFLVICPVKEDNNANGVNAQILASGTTATILTEAPITETTTTTTTTTFLNTRLTTDPNRVTELTEPTTEETTETTTTTTTEPVTQPPEIADDFSNDYNNNYYNYNDDAYNNVPPPTTAPPETSTGEIIQEPAMTPEEQEFVNDYEQEW